MGGPHFPSGEEGLSKTRMPIASHELAAGTASITAVRVGAWIALALLFACSRGADSEPDEAPCVAQLASAELLTNITAHSAIVSWVSSSEASFEVSFAPTKAPQKARILKARGMAGELVEVELEDLEPGTSYDYRLGCASDSKQVMAERPGHRFRTLRSKGDTLSFAFLSDSHAYRIWATAQASDDPVDQVPLDLLSQTLTNAREHDVDFIILGGDEAMTHCLHCPDVAVDGESGGTNTARTARQAELRYLVWRRLYEEAGGDLPLFLVLGNHDGEAGFGNLAGDCDHYQDTAALSVGARKRLLPDPLRSYSGGNQGAYFSFVSGDALFVILDVMGGPSDYPQTPGDWTLGAGQLAWLETTLASSREHWKFLIAHHVVGGHPRGAPCYAYGRGGVNATRNGQSDGEFNGQQATIHRLMLRYGAQFFLYGHDHIFSFAEKKDSSGRGDAVYYVAGGQSSRTPSVWLNKPWFQQLYDIDGDGIGDFLDVPGFLQVTLDADQSARFRYILSDPQKPERNGAVVFDRTIKR